VKLCHINHSGVCVKSISCTTLPAPLVLSYRCLY